MATTGADDSEYRLLFADPNERSRRIWRAFFALNSPCDNVSTNLTKPGLEIEKDKLWLRVIEGEPYIKEIKSTFGRVTDAFAGAIGANAYDARLPAIMNKLAHDDKTWPRKNGQGRVADVAFYEDLVSPKPSADAMATEKLMSLTNVFMLFRCFVKFAWNLRNSTNVTQIVCADRSLATVVSIQNTTSVDQVLLVSVACADKNTAGSVKHIVLEIPNFTLGTIDDDEHIRWEGNPDLLRDDGLCQRALTTVLKEVSVSTCMNAKTADSFEDAVKRFQKAVNEQFEVYIDFCAKEAQAEWQYDGTIGSAAKLYAHKMMTLKPKTDVQHKVKEPELQRTRLGAVDEWLKYLNRKSSRNPRACTRTKREDLFSVNFNPELLRRTLHIAYQIGTHLVDIKKNVQATVLIAFVSYMLDWARPSTNTAGALINPSTTERESFVALAKLICETLPAYLRDVKENGGQEMKIPLTEPSTEDSTPLFPNGKSLTEINELFRGATTVDEIYQDRERFESERDHAMLAAKELQDANDALSTKIKGKQRDLDALVQDIATKSQEVQNLTDLAAQVEALKAEMATLDVSIAAGKADLKTLEDTRADVQRLVDEKTGKHGAVEKLEEDIAAVDADIGVKQGKLEAQTAAKELIDKTLADLEERLGDLSRRRLRPMMANLIAGVRMFSDDKQILKALGLSEERIKGIADVIESVEDESFLERLGRWLTGMTGIHELNKENDFSRNLQQLIQAAKEISDGVQTLSSHQFNDILKTFRSTEASLNELKAQRSSILDILQIEFPEYPRGTKEEDMAALRSAITYLETDGTGVFTNFDVDIDSKMLQNIAKGLQLQREAVELLRANLARVDVKDVEELKRAYSRVFAAFADIQTVQFNRLGHMLDKGDFNDIGDCSESADTPEGRECRLERGEKISKKVKVWSDIIDARVKEWQNEVVKLKIQANVELDHIKSTQGDIEAKRDQARKLDDTLRALNAEVERNDAETKKLRSLADSFKVDTVTAEAKKALLAFRDGVINKLSDEQRLSLKDDKETFDDLQKVSDSSSLNVHDFQVYAGLADKVKQVTGAREETIKQWTTKMEDLKRQLDLWTAKRKEFAETNAALKTAQIEAVREEAKATANKVRPQEPFFPQQPGAAGGGWGGYVGGGMGYPQQQQQQQAYIRGNPYAVARGQQLQQLQGGWGAGRRGAASGTMLSLPRPPPMSLKEWNRMRKSDLRFNPF